MIPYADTVTERICQDGQPGARCNNPSDCVKLPDLNEVTHLCSLPVRPVSPCYALLPISYRLIRPACGQGKCIEQKAPYATGATERICQDGQPGAYCNNPSDCVKLPGLNEVTMLPPVRPVPPSCALLSACIGPACGQGKCISGKCRDGQPGHSDGNYGEGSWYDTSACNNPSDCITPTGLNEVTAPSLSLLFAPLTLHVYSCALLSALHYPARGQGKCIESGVGKKCYDGEVYAMCNNDNDCIEKDCKYHSNGLYSTCYSSSYFAYRMLADSAI